VATKLGTRAFLVGGPVRDLMLGCTSPDLDVAVETNSREFGKVVALELGGRFLFHSRFLTGTITLPDSSHIDITRTRTESYTRPAVLPRVRPAHIRQDLVRRDFTINAMALELAPRSFGRIIDPCNGQVDLSHRIVRVLHDRSFVDDPTRIFRCIKFAARFGFEIEERTLRLMREAVALRYVSLLTPERALWELKLVCAEPLVLQMVEALLKENVLQSTWGWTPPESLLPGLARLVQSRAAPDLLFLFLLSTLPVTDRFPIRKEERDAADALNTFGAARTRLTRACKPSTVYRLLHPVPELALKILAELEPVNVSRHIKDQLRSFSRIRPEITGRDLRAMGIEPGPRYRAILERVLYARLDGRVQSREDELRLCRRMRCAGKR
jgi:tRNA nucleotidyltransferase (CCA-adding enzyme)